MLKSLPFIRLQRPSLSSRAAASPLNPHINLNIRSLSRTATMAGPKDIDTSLHASTSGRAASLAKAHSSPHDLKLYGGWFCPFVQRSWIALHEKKIPHQYVEINPYHKAPEFLALNPRGLVPTLSVPVHEKTGSEQKPLYESVVICSFLDEVFSDTSTYGPSLLPEDAYERARCRIWIDHVSTRIIPGFYRFLQHTPDKNYTVDEARDEFLGHIKTFVRECADPQKGPFFLGEQFSMVDLMLAPWACRLFLIEHYKPGGLGIPDAGKGGEDDEEIWNRWHVWFDAVRNRPSVMDTWSDDDQYVEAYKRYAEDTTGSQVGQATRSGRGLP